MAKETFTIAKAAAMLNRKPRTLRQWEHAKLLPDHLIPPRNQFGHRVYTKDLIEHTREWLIARGIRHGTNFIRAQAVA